MHKPLPTAEAISDLARKIFASEERRVYLDQVCGSDAELRQRVEQLLRAQEEPISGPDRAAATLDTQDVEPGRWFKPQALPGTHPEGVGSQIGPYKLLQQIGEGGMGMVFMAEQQEPVRRMVAVKVIKAGMDSAQVIARFEAERQALALMDHPNIAKVLDANTSPTGRPYFVMELVKGVPITKYCDEQRLTLRQRLELFVPVCQAIQHAHQKAIIHRDIKPSNVLIAAYDGKPVPKIIDFGVAKAMGQKLTDRTLFTGFGGIIGTLEYMSPEQAEFNALDIDTLSDVYSLGVLLYELLTGTTPLTRQRLKDAALMDVLRLIREEEAPRPSTRLSATRDSLASVSAQRHMEPSALVKAVRGEVDWIVMKALEKDRTRRYETANGLAKDIQHFLADEPVEAGPPSATYRLRKLAWKHRRSLTMAAALLSLLVAGVVVSSCLAVWALQAEKQARTAEQEAREQRDKALAAEAEAKEQRDKAIAAEQATRRSEEDVKAVLEFFQAKVLSAGRPEGQEGGLGNQVTLRKAVDAAEPEIAKAFGDRPLVEASIRNVLGLTYYFLSQYPQAIRQHERALALREAKLGINNTDTLNSRGSLAGAYYYAGRIPEAIRLLEAVLRQREATLGSDHPTTLTMRNNLAETYFGAGRTEEALRLHEQNLKQRIAKLGPDHADTLQSRNNLATLFWSVGRIDEALGLHEQNLKQLEAKRGPDHPDTLTSRNNLAIAYWSAGRSADAIRLQEPTLRQMEAKLGPDHYETLRCCNNLAEMYRTAGRRNDAIRLYERNLKRMEEKLGIDNPLTLTCRNNLANVYRDAGRATDAIGMHEQNLKLSQAKLGSDHPNTLTFQDNLADTYDQAGQFAKAEPLYRALLEQKRKHLGAEHPETASPMAVLGWNLLRQHKYADAEPILRDCLKDREAKQPDSWTTFNTRSVLGAALLGQKKFADAERLLLSGYQGMKQREKTIPEQGKGRLIEALDRLVKLYEALGKKDETEKWRKESEQAKTKPQKEPQP